MNMYAVVSLMAEDNYRHPEDSVSRAARLVSVLAHDLAERDEDEALLEELLCAAEDHGLQITFPAVCAGCLKDFPRTGEQFCAACIAAAAQLSAAVAMAPGS